MAPEGTLALGRSDSHAMLSTQDGDDYRNAIYVV